MTSGNINCSSNYSTEATVAFATTMTLFMLFTIIGNVLVIIAVLTYRALRGPQNLFLVSLAVADILVAALVMPFNLANELMGCWYFEQIWCKILLALDVLFCTSSIIHLCTISLDRYLSVSRPVQYGTQRTPRKIKCAIVVVWLISAVISSPLLVLEENQNQKCELNNEVWYILYSCIGSFFVPCFIMILVYVRIYQIAKKHARCPPGEQRKERLDIAPAEQNGRDGAVGPAGAAHIRTEDQHKNKRTRRRKDEDSSSSGSDGDAAGDANGTTSVIKPGHQKSSQSRNVIVTSMGSQLASPNAKPTRSSRKKAVLVREKRFTFVLAIVIGVFVVCWFPFFFTYSLQAICGDACTVPETVFITFFWTGYCNSAMNPLIYTIFNRDFRRAFRKILCKSCKTCSL